MSRWGKISLFKFQEIDRISNKPGLTELDKTLFSACIVFGYTEFELDNLPVKKVEKLALKMGNIFNSTFKTRPLKRIGRYQIKYDVSKMTFGQYIELAFFLSNKPIYNAHYVLASISNIPFLKNNPKYHRRKADYFLKVPVTQIIGCLNLIMEKFSSFNKEYKTLFGLNEEVSGDVQADLFNKRYGWIYSASQVAEYERISNEEAFRLPVRQAFNDLTYLKAKAAYEAEQFKKNNNVTHGR